MCLGSSTPVCRWPPYCRTRKRCGSSLSVAPSEGIRPSRGVRWLRCATGRSASLESNADRGVRCDGEAARFCTRSAAGAGAIGRATAAEAFVGDCARLRARSRAANSRSAAAPRSARERRGGSAGSSSSFFENASGVTPSGTRAAAASLPSIDMGERSRGRVQAAQK